MIADILRFYRESVAMVAADRIPDHTLGRLLRRWRLTGAPFSTITSCRWDAAIWSADNPRDAGFSSQYLPAFLLQSRPASRVNDQPQMADRRGWLAGLCRAALGRLSAPDSPGDAVRAVSRSGRRRDRRDRTAMNRRHFDARVVLHQCRPRRWPCSRCDPKKKPCWGSFRFQPNIRHLHTDRR